MKVEERNGEVSLTVRSAVWEKPNWYAKREVFTTLNMGKTWEAEFGQVASSLLYATELMQAPSDPQVLYKLLPDMGLFLRSEDAGKTWVLPKHLIEATPHEEFANRTGGSRHYRTTFWPLAIHPTKPLMVFAALRVDPWAVSKYELPRHEISAVYVSNDGGEKWKEFTDALQTSPGWSATLPPPIGINPSNPSIMFGQTPLGIVKSIDGGQTWSAVGQQHELHARPLYEAEAPEILKANGLPIDYHFIGFPIAMEITQFLFHPVNPDVVYVVSNKGIHRTMNGGQTWVLLNLELPEIGSVRNALLNPLNPNQLIVGTAHGVFVSQDDGCNFRRLPHPRKPNM